MIKTSRQFVLIRGLLREQRHWGEFVDYLQLQFPDADILLLDIPGNGALYQQTSPNSIAAMTDALRAQLPERRDLSLIALSMGGMIAIDWMHRYPTEITSAVLINTSVRSYAPFYQRLRWRCYPTIVGMLRGAPEQMEQQILALTSNLRSHDRELLSRWQKWRAQCPVSKVSAINQLLAAAKFTCQSKPLLPILMVASENDRLVDCRCSLKLHQAWGGSYQQHARAGHDLPLDAPEWLSWVIYRWMLSV